MIIGNFNKLPSRIDGWNEEARVLPSTLLAELFIMINPIAHEIKIFLNIDTLRDLEVLALLKHHFRKTPEHVAMMDQAIQDEIDMQKLIRSKPKDKDSLVLIGRHRALKNKFRETLKKATTGRLEFMQLMELLPFEKEKCWSLHHSLGEYAADEENKYIYTVTNVILQHRVLMCYHSIVEELLPYLELGSVADTSFDFIKIPMWKFPWMPAIKFNQIKYTQQGLKKPMQEFTVHLDELTNQLFKIPFIADNHDEIMTLCREKIVANLEPVQKTIDESLYLIHYRNQTPPDVGIKFHLGIASAASLIDYYEKAEIIQPYVATEIKHRLSREINLQSTCIFSYFTIQKPEEDKIQ